jgi:(p)ppGpp synthase/HD superfamily hydrolase
VVVKAAPTPLGPRFVEAVSWSAALHADQGRKGRDHVPYMSHLLAVAALTLEDGGTEDDAVVALCHDAVEDQGGHEALAEVRRRFGDDIARAVDLLSDSCSPRGVPKAPWAERKRALLAKLSGPDVPEGVLRVAAADKLHNARSLLAQLHHDGPQTWKGFRATPAEAVWFYRSCATLLAKRLPDSINAGELARIVAELEHWVQESERAVPA